MAEALGVVEGEVTMPGLVSPFVGVVGAETRGLRPTVSAAVALELRLPG